MARARTRAGHGPQGTDRADEHVAHIRQEEAVVELLERTQDELRPQHRSLVGVGDVAAITSLRSTLRAADVGLYPAVALGLLVMVDQLQTTALTVLGPEVSAALGVSRPVYALVLLTKTLVLTVAALPIAALVQRRPRRAALCVGTAVAWAVCTLATGFVISIWELLLLGVIAGAATASVRALHEPLLLDSYPPAARMRVMSLYRGFNNVGDVIGPLVIAVCAVLLGLTWRGAFVAMGVIAAAAAATASRLRDPGFGKWDTERLREAVRTDESAPDAVEADAVALGFFETARRILLIPTARRSLAAFAVLGMMLAPLTTYLAFFLQERWGMGAAERSVFFAIMPVFGIVGLRLFGRRGEELFSQDPARLLRLAGWLMSVGISSLGLAVFAPSFPLMAVLFGGALAMVTVMLPAMSLPVYAVVAAPMRPHMAALQGIFLTGVGGTAGLLLLGGIDRRFGTGGAILSLALPGIAAGLVLRSAATTVNDDLDRMIAEIVEAEEVKDLQRRGMPLPMLAVRHVDFSYGQLQILFGVDFTVDDGEIVGLLGTNGAGKSTLLRVISGLGLPQRGSVRFQGHDITYLDAERRVTLGIAQVPGGRAVFGDLSVADNLRVIGYTHGKDRRSIETGIEASFEAFPRLAERRDQLASTLSGGEQQMLGLSTALILRPRLLLVDELSLGLAPRVVGELLEMIRLINRQGTAVVLVEQSVNVALSIVQHAYFMEKGEVRFDGAAQDLLARPDLLRSVFLEGASKGLAEG
ncbi:MAG TPA: MFS transporter [Acidimicrobiales bacterium]|nr:MFS transporter [Acidimicrobiales bacterium]